MNTYICNLCAMDIKGSTAYVTHLMNQHEMNYQEVIEYIREQERQEQENKL